jgi:hypothetical protein
MSYNNGSLPFPQPPPSSSSFQAHQQQQYYQSNSNSHTTTNAGGQQQQQPQRSNSIDYTQRLPQLSWPNIHHEQRQSAPSTSQQQQQPPSSRSQMITESPADSGAGSDAEDLPQSATTNNAYPRNNKRKSQTGNGSESGERGGSNSKKKRNRAVLSCAPCKARKVGLFYCWVDASDADARFVYVSLWICSDQMRQVSHMLFWMWHAVPSN